MSTSVCVAKSTLRVIASNGNVTKSDNLFQEQATKFFANKQKTKNRLFRVPSIEKLSLTEQRRGNSGCAAVPFRAVVLLQCFGRYHAHAVVDDFYFLSAFSVYIFRLVYDNFLYELTHDFGREFFYLRVPSHHAHELRCVVRLFLSR